MNEDGSVLLEGLLSWLVLVSVLLLAAAVARRELGARLEEHANFVEARRSLMRPR